MMAELKEFVVVVNFTMRAETATAAKEAAADILKYLSRDCLLPKKDEEGWVDWDVVGTLQEAGPV